MQTLPRGVVPMGAKNTHLKTVKGTVQMIGKPRAKVPEKVNADFGIVDFFISDYGQRIEVGGKGLETNVGRGVDSPTKGMSVPSQGISRSEIGTVKPAHSVSRTAISATTKPDRVKGEIEMRGVNRPEVVEERKRVAEERVESARIRQVEPEPRDLYFDEDPGWLRGSDAHSTEGVSSKGVNRAKMSKKKPKRIGKRDNQPTVVRSVRL